MNSCQINDLIEYYRQQGAPADQQMVFALLREVQEADGGVLTHGALEQIAAAYGMKTSMLMAVVRRLPGLRCETAPHRLEICGTCRAGTALRDYIEKTYGIRSGGVSEAAGFSYRVTPCMKNCKNGPSILWDGQLYSRADEALIKKLIGS